MYKTKSGFSLYLWLTLFTLFISFFSIILFNYVSSDIRTTKELIRKSRRTIDLKSLVIIATNIYRQDYTRANGNIPYKGKNYQYEIKNIDGSYIYVKILENNNPLAKAIVLYKINLGSYNKLSTQYNGYYFNSNSYYGNTLNLSDRIDIEKSSNKIFNILFLKHSTQPYKLTFDSYGNPSYTKITDKELTQKYTKKLYKVDLDPINYYNKFFDIVMQQIYEVPNNVMQQIYGVPANDVELNTKGTIIIRKSSENDPTILFKLDESNPNNQKIDILYGINPEASFTLVRSPQTFYFEKNNSSLKTNDISLANEFKNLNNQSKSNEFSITLNPTNNYVYKVLKRGNNYIIYKTRNSLIYILVFANPIIGTDNNLSTNNAIIKEKIYLITDKNYFTTVKGHILYEETANKITNNYNNQLIDPNKINKNNISVNNNNNLFTLVTNSIKIDGSNFNLANPKIVLCGKYIALYNSNSDLSLINNGNLNSRNIDSVYVYGGIHSAIFNTAGLNEYYINDKRLSYIDPVDIFNIHTDRIIAIDFNY
ncbi:MAG: hypothetical protein ACP5RD_01935 [bacterium]